MPLANNRHCLGQACRSQALLTCLLGLFAAPAMAHDFWIQPNDYWVNPSTPVAFSLQVGHGPFRQRSPIPLGRIARFEAIGMNESKIDLRDRLELGGQADDGHIAFSKPGNLRAGAGNGCARSESSTCNTLQ